MSIFNRKQHEAIADILHSIGNEDVRAAVAIRFVDYLTQDNKRFEERYFMTKAGVIDG